MVARPRGGAKHPPRQVDHPIARLLPPQQVERGLAAVQALGGSLALELVQGHHGVAPLLPPVAVVTVFRDVLQYRVTFGVSHNEPCV